MLDLMTDRRQEQLIKAAEETIGLMNVGVEPNAALRKVSKDFNMNDKEVTLVSHAVNNSKQLAHLQTAAPEEKETPFPLTNAEAVIGANSKADLDDTTEKADKAEDQPDALEIQAKIKKDAADESYIEKSNLRIPTRDYSEEIGILNSSWGMTKAADYVESELGNPYHVTNDLKLAMDEANIRYNTAKEKTAAILDKVAFAFTLVTAPSFSEFEKAAGAEGITDELVDLVYEAGELESLGTKRYTGTKVAGVRTYASKRICDLVGEVKKADALWREAADCLTAKGILEEQINECHTKISKDEGGGGVFQNLVEGASSSAKTVSEGAGSLFGMGETPTDVMQNAMGVGKLETPSPEVSLDYSVNQQMANSKAHSSINQLLNDPFISKHNLADVIDAYNRAVSVNQSFGAAEISAYVKHDLASRGNVPLDLMIRARKGVKKDEHAV